MHDSQNPVTTAAAVSDELRQMEQAALALKAELAGVSEAMVEGIDAERVVRGYRDREAFAAFYGLGAEPFSEIERERLRAPVPDDELDILPTGEVYLSQIGYRDRLLQTFGAGAWGLFPLSEPQVIGGVMNQTWLLVVRGRAVAMAVGEHDYDPAKKWSASYATALESCKSNALMRCCKDIGVAAQCWSRSFTEAWKKQFAVRVYREQRSGEETDEWRKLDAGPHWNETGLHPGSPNAEAWKAQMEEAGKSGRMRSKGARPAAATTKESKPETKATTAPAAAATKAADTKPQQQQSTETKADAGDKAITTAQYAQLKEELKKNSVSPATLFLWLHQVKLLPEKALLETRDGIEVESGRRIPQRLYADVLQFIKDGGQYTVPKGA